MNNPWIEFLRHYGPIPANDNMYDEAVHVRLMELGIKPIEIDVPFLKDYIQNFQSSNPDSVILTGTAGDGKTYCCRHIWTALGGKDSDWSKISKHAEIPLLGSGRTLLIIKDLSELNEEDDHLIVTLTDIVLGECQDKVFLIAANDGQLLSAWRKFLSNGEKYRKAFDVIERMLVDGQSADSAHKLRMQNLSRQQNSKIFESVLQAVLNHPGWGNCSACPFSEAKEGGIRCPINENRYRLQIGSEGGDLFKKRLVNLIRLSELDGQHFPIRHLLLLIVNALLGNVRLSGKSNSLMRCSDVIKIITDKETEPASPYANVFGGNLPEREAIRFPVFANLSRFGIGSVSVSEMDDALIYGILDQEENEKNDDQFYGRNVAFDQARRAYLEGDARDDSFKIIREHLTRQRQRLFFTLPDSEKPVRMSVLRHASDYLAFREHIVSGNKHLVKQKIKTLVQGVNRLFTGLMLTEKDELHIASAGAGSTAVVNRVLEKSIKASDILVSHDDQRDALILSCPFAENVELVLTPSIFEIIMQAADGVIPLNLSRESLEDVQDFRLKLLQSVESGEPGGDLSYVLIDVAEKGKIEAREIDIVLEAAE